MRQEIIDGYANDADSLIPAFEAIPSETLWAPVIELFPSAGTVVDIGAGTGRDAGWLASKGFSIVAVEPTASLREAASRLHSSGRIEWVDDSLPALSIVLKANQRFDLILMNAVWQHVLPEDRPTAWDSLRRLAAPASRLILSVRHGPGAPNRETFPASDDVTIEQAQSVGFVLCKRRSAASIQERNRAAGVNWTWLAFELPET
jgi:SAM-dependent methyltransferase